MMSRFKSLMIGATAALIATAAHAERTLTRAEVVDMIDGNAVCYQLDNGACYAAEFFKRVRLDTIDVTYALTNLEALLIVQERATWRGSAICVTAEASGIVKAWDTPVGDNHFQFDLANATARSRADLDIMRVDFAASRDIGYCYYFTSDSDGLTGLRSYYEIGEGTASAPIVLIPFTDEFLTLE